MMYFDYSYKNCTSLTAAMQTHTHRVHTSSASADVSFTDVFSSLFSFSHWWSSNLRTSTASCLVLSLRPAQLPATVQQHRLPGH